MDDFAPSFSLGIDFDLDSEPQLNDPTVVPPPSLNKSDDCFQSPLPDPDTRPSLKRLRRGPKPQVTWCNVDDEIEDFSSDDYSDELPSTQYKSVCGSSKLSLPKHGVLSSQSSKKRKDVTYTKSSENANRSSDNVMFPKLTVSPLRKFHLIDSDSDFDVDDLTGNGYANNGDASKPGSSSKERQSSPYKNGSMEEELIKEAQASVSRNDDLWSDFCLDKKIPIQTPVFDEVCEEYFRSAKDTNNCSTARVGNQRNKNKNSEQQLDSGVPLPPAHSYFSHDDIRIQNLVRSRLPNFFPLMTQDIREYDQPNASVIDYMGQFNHGKSSKQASGKKNAVPNSAKSRKQSKKTNFEEVSQGSGSWVNPKSSTKIPKNAGKRRVQASSQSTQSAGQSSQSAGHWYTGSNGKRVYVTKAGKELTGTIAYRHYKKETEGGFTKKSGSRKKSVSKKK